MQCTHGYKSTLLWAAHLRYLPFTDLVHTALLKVLNRHTTAKQNLISSQSLHCSYIYTRYISSMDGGALIQSTTVRGCARTESEMCCLLTENPNALKKSWEMKKEELFEAAVLLVASARAHTSSRALWRQSMKTPFRENNNYFSLLRLLYWCARTYILRKLWTVWHLKAVSILHVNWTVLAGRNFFTRKKCELNKQF